MAEVLTVRDVGNALDSKSQSYLKVAEVLTDQTVPPNLHLYSSTVPNLPRTNMSHPEFFLTHDFNRGDLTSRSSFNRFNGFITRHPRSSFIHLIHLTHHTHLSNITSIVMH